MGSPLQFHNKGLFGGFGQPSPYNRNNICTPYPNEFTDLDTLVKQQKEQAKNKRQFQEVDSRRGPDADCAPDINTYNANVPGGVTSWDALRHFHTEEVFTFGDTNPQPEDVSVMTIPEGWAAYGVSGRWSLSNSYYYRFLTVRFAINGSAILASNFAQRRNNYVVIPYVVSGGQSFSLQASISRLPEIGTVTAYFDITGIIKSQLNTADVDPAQIPNIINLNR